MSKKISQLDPIDLITGEEELPIRIGNLNYKVKINDIVSKVTKTTIGLGNVDNTPDSEKIVSLPQQQALDTKVDKEDFNRLSTVLDGKASRYHTHEINQVVGLSDILTSINTDIFNLSNRATIAENYIVELNNRINNFVIPNSFDIEAVVGLSAILQDFNVRIAGKADKEHQHAVTDITGLDEAIDAKLNTKFYVSIGESEW